MRRGFGKLPCLKCGAESTHTLDIEDFDSVTCADCGDNYQLDEVRAVLASWGKLLAWLETAPALPADES